MTWRVPGRRTRERLVVIGNGPAGMRAVEEILDQAPDRYDITIFGAEPHHAYNRILLSAVLAGDKTADDIVTHPQSWHEECGIALVAGDPVVAIHRAAQTVVTANGMEMDYDKLLQATGSKPVAPPIPGLTLPGVTAFRDLADVERMMTAAGTGSRVVVIGGGLLGLEAAWGLKRQGMAVTVIHLMPTLMERQLDATAAGLLQRELSRRGIDFVTNAQTEEIIGADWRAADQPPPLYTSLKITGVDVFSAGAIATADEADDLVTLSDTAAGVYRKLVSRGDRLVGCVLYGNVRDGPWYVELIQSRREYRTVARPSDLWL